MLYKAVEWLPLKKWHVVNYDFPCNLEPKMDSRQQHCNIELRQKHSNMESLELKIQTQIFFNRKINEK